MGTRHFQKVINKEGEVKIAQYGQWDGYPSGQGVEILRYLKSGNLAKYQEELDKIPLINDEQKKMVNQEGDKWAKKYPYLSRDCGSDIHQMIEDGNVKFVLHMDDDEANQWCEGFYTIDFKENVFISVFDKELRYPLDNLPTEEKYLRDNENNDEEPEEGVNSFAASFDDKIKSVEGIVERLEEILVEDEDSGGKLPKKAIDRISLAITKGEELVELLSDIASAATLGEIGDEEE